MECKYCNGAVEYDSERLNVCCVCGDLIRGWKQWSRYADVASIQLPSCDIQKEPLFHFEPVFMFERVLSDSEVDAILSGDLDPAELEGYIDLREGLIDVETDNRDDADCGVNDGGVGS